MVLHSSHGATFISDDLGKEGSKNDIRDVGSTADLVLVLLVHLVHWYLVHGLIGTSGALVPGTLVPTVT